MLSRSWATPAGFVAGTLPYMSPEQTEGVRDDPRVDVYALGAVLYRALTGQTYLNFDQQDTPRAQADNVYRIYNLQPQPPSTLNPGVPPWLDAIVMKALAKRREDRFGGADQLRAALLQQVQVAGPATPPPMSETVLVPPGTRPTAPGSPEKRSGLPPLFWPLLAAAVIVLFVTVAGLLAALGGGDGGRQTATPEPSLIALATEPAPLPTQAIDTPFPPETPQATTLSSPTDATLPPAASPASPATVRATNTLEPAPDTPLPRADTPQPPTTVPADTPPAPTAIPTDTPRPPTAPPTDTPIPAPHVYLDDQFNGSSLNSAVWQAYPNGGTVRTGNGKLHLTTSPGSTQFPYVHARGNPFPQQGDFTVRFGFSYSQPTWSGTGIVVGGRLPANGTANDPKNEPGAVLFAIWQDKGLGLAAMYGGPALPEHLIYQHGGTDEGQHNGQLRYTGGAYQVWIDGQQVYQSPPTNVRPSALWFGNPIVQDPSNPAVDLNWTGLHIDHVSIQEAR